MARNPNLVWKPEAYNYRIQRIREGWAKRKALIAQREDAVKRLQACEVLEVSQPSGDRPAMALAYAFVSGLGMAVGYFIKWLIGC